MAQWTVSDTHLSCSWHIKYRASNALQMTVACSRKIRARLGPVSGVVMSAGSQVASIYRFGTFELDTRSAELRKNGVKLKIQEQPYQVLLKLLEHPGEIVSRDELEPRFGPLTHSLILKLG